MPELKCDILIVGGGVGGCAAAMSACSLGINVILSEETDWIGGQLTSQAVPPDEHPWIEHFGCTRRYRQFREGVRHWYRENRNLSADAASDPFLNPGGGWVSKLCFEPKVGLEVLNAQLRPMQQTGMLRILLRHKPTAVSESNDRIESIALKDLETGETRIVQAAIFLDATETGELLPLSNTEYVVGAESISETGEPHALAGAGQQNNVQGFTWCFAMGWDPNDGHTISRPDQYDRWKSYRPKDWPGPMLGWTYPNPITGKPTALPLFNSGSTAGLFDYRQIVSAKTHSEHVEQATIVNWPQNDYFEGSILDVSEDVAKEQLHNAKQHSLSLLYWLQTEAPSPDGGVGYPGLCLRPDLTGTDDGFAKAPYVRESRRIKSFFTIKEQHVSADCNLGKYVADPLPKSVGVGAYRIDLHPSTNGVGYIDIGSLLFQIPLGALIPERMRNVLPACKNIGTTHITNGCYRLHPVEWNIGESAGLLAAFCFLKKCDFRQVLNDDHRFADFHALMQDQGIESYWPQESEAIGLNGNTKPLGPL